MNKHTPKPQLEVQVAPGIYQPIEDYEANMRFDEERDNRLQDEISDNPVY